jgi:hypothetical protein
MNRDQVESVLHIENLLRRQLVKDRAHPSRRRVEGDTTIIKPSGTALGLAFRVSLITGEDENAIMDRVGQ